MTYLKICVLSLFVIGFLTFNPQLKAQCNPQFVPFSVESMSYEVEELGGMTRVLIYLDHSPPQTMGVMGFSFQIYLEGLDSKPITVCHDLNGSWIFNSAAITSSSSYNAAANHVQFSAQRLDCKGAAGSGFIGEVIIYHEQDETVSVLEVDGSIILIDNIDAG